MNDATMTQQPEADEKTETAKAIADMREARISHVHWAEHFEAHPEEESRYAQTGEWDTAEIHREWVAKYDRVINLLAATLEETNK